LSSHYRIWSMKTSIWVVKTLILVKQLTRYSRLYMVHHRLQTPLLTKSLLDQ
jgi:hypothetical protein